MKKLFICMVLFISCTAVFAQFEKNTWFVNPSFTGLDLSFNKDNKTHFGFGVNGGAFIYDNLAVILKLEGDYGKHQTNLTTVGAGGRYYFDKRGIYVGAGLNYDRYGGDRNDASLGLEAGYAYFINKTITLEPGVYYNQSFTDHSAYSRFGIKLGIGLYF